MAEVWWAQLPPRVDQQPAGSSGFQKGSEVTCGFLASGGRRENWFKVCPGRSRVPRSSPGDPPCPHRRKEGKWTFWRETLKVGRWDHTGSEGTEWSPHTEQRVFCPHQAPSPHWDPRTQSLRRRDEPELRASFPAVGIPQ